MHDELILKAAKIMNDQAAAYERLQGVVNQLSAALVRGEPSIVESLTKAGEAELLKMRSCLVEVTSCLTKFTEQRALEKEKAQLDVKTREQFEEAAKSLVEAAREFQLAAAKASSLAHAGSSFASACVQVAGVPAMTYRAPVIRNSEGGQPGEY